MVAGKITEAKEKIPTVGTKVIETDGFHRRIVARSYVVVLTEIGGSRVKAVRLDNQTTWVDAIQTAITDNPGWRFKRCDELMDRDFAEGERI